MLKHSGALGVLKCRFFYFDGIIQTVRDFEVVSTDASDIDFSLYIKEPGFLYFWL